MEQMQNLTTQYALGMRRLEDKQREQEMGGGQHPASSGQHPASVGQDPASITKDMKKRSWRVLVALQNAANRAKWVSFTEGALFVHTEALHWRVTVKCLYLSAVLSTWQMNANASCQIVNTCSPNQQLPSTFLSLAFNAREELGTVKKFPAPDNTTTNRMASQTSATLAS